MDRERARKLTGAGGWWREQLTDEDASGRLPAMRALMIARWQATTKAVGGWWSGQSGWRMVGQAEDSGQGKENTPTGVGGERGKKLQKMMKPGCGR